MSGSVRFYFSFRSPYSWLGFYRISKIIDQLPVTFEFIPVYPPENSEKFPTKKKGKMSYIDADIKRFVEAYGLTLKWPKPFDTNWVIPHAAYLYANENNKGLEFGLAAHTARFSEGQDIGSNNVLKVIASDCGLDTNEIITAAHASEYHKKVLKGMVKTRMDKMFGVPFFIYNKERYWGNDRLEWLIRDIYRHAGENLPVLVDDPFIRPF